MAQIELIGDDNYVLIDDNFKNMILAQKSTVFFPVPAGANVVGSFTTFSYTPSLPISAPPLLALNSTFPVTVQSMVRSGNAWVWTLVSSAAGRGASVEAFVFHLPETVPNANGMLQLFNSLGELVFDSSLRYSKVEASLSHNLDNPSSITLAAGKKYACVTSMAAGSFYAVQYPPLTRPPIYGVAETADRCGFYMQGAQVLTNKFTFTYRTYGAQNPVVASYEKLSGLLLIFDVTNM